MITVYVGPMFSGKTTALIEDSQHAERAKQPVLRIKYDKDVRFGDDRKSMISSHDGVHIGATPVSTLEKFTDPLLNDPRSRIYIDEGHMIPGLVAFCDQMAREGHRVHVATLRSDYRREPFECIARLMAKAEVIRCFDAICVKCGHTAHFTERTICTKDHAQVLVGGSDKYQPVCRSCHVILDQ